MSNKAGICGGRAEDPALLDELKIAHGPAAAWITRSSGASLVPSHPGAWCEERTLQEHFLQS